MSTLTDTYTWLPSRAVSAFTVGLSSHRILFRDTHAGLAAISHAALFDILPRNVIDLVTPIPIELTVRVARHLHMGGAYFTFLSSDINPRGDGECYSLSWDADIDVLGVNAADAFMRDIFSPSNRTLREELNSLRLRRDVPQALRTIPPTPSAFIREVLRTAAEVVPAPAPPNVRRVGDPRQRFVRRRK